MMIDMPSIMISAPKSSSGKTVFTCGLLKAIQDMGLKPSVFKCGPDYIDPLFHKSVFSVNSTNLDLFFLTPNRLKKLYYEKSDSTDIAVIEGAMGFYDGMGGISDKNSAYDISKTLGVPVVLLVDIKGSSLSVCALIKGFLDFRKDNNICGIILNRCSKSLFLSISPIISENINLPVFGYIPQEAVLNIESRQLGLNFKKEVFENQVIEISKIIKSTVDIPKILKCSKESKKIEFSEENIFLKKYELNISVARDEVFYFYYEENIEFLKKAGAKITYFSPLNDDKIPQNTDLIYIGGGYPELFAKQLSQNINMKLEILDFYNRGGSIFAEGAGFIYLHNSLYLNDIDYVEFLGIIKESCEMTDKLQNFGYTELSCIDKSLGFTEKIKAHEFHYCKSQNDGEFFTAKKPTGKKIRKTIILNNNLFCGFPQLYFYGSSEGIFNILERCLKNKIENGKNFK